MSENIEHRDKQPFFKQFSQDIKEWIRGGVESVKELVKESVQFVTVDLWNINIRKQRPVHYYLKVVAHTIGINKKGEENDTKVKFRLGSYSSSLSFFSVLAFIPFIAAIFFVTKGFGLDTHLESIIKETFAGNEEILGLLLNLAKNIIDSGKNGLFGAISFLVFIWAIIWLIINIERAFDDIWGTQKMRGFGKQLLYYIGFILISPFILILLLSVLVFVNNALGNYGVKIWYFETISAFVQWVIYYLLSIIAFTVINKSIPNRKVRWGSALKASMITAFAFVIVQFLYTGTQLMVTRLNAVYGAFAAFPLFLIWLNVSWTIVLIGAKITKAFQIEDEMKILAKQSSNE